MEEYVLKKVMIWLMFVLRRILLKDKGTKGEKKGLNFQKNYLTEDIFRVEINTFHSYFFAKGLYL